MGAPESSRALGATAHPSGTARSPEPVAPAGLADPDVPFPVDGTWSAAPGLAPLTDGVLRLDADDRRYRAARLAVLRAHPERVRMLGPGADVASATDAWRQAAEVVAAEAPSRMAVEGATVRAGALGVAIDTAVGRAVRDGPVPRCPVAAACRAHLLGLAGWELLADAVGLSVPDDIAWVRGGPGGDDVAALSVAFPSGWRPEEVIGHGFAAVHRPVAHSDRLVRAASGMVRALTQGRPLVRWVWGLPARGHLRAHPDLVPAPQDGLDALAVVRRTWLRVERQVCWPLPSTRTGAANGLFWIRTWCAPLALVVDAPGRAALLAGAVAGMDAEALAYKGLVGRRDELLAWLESRACGQST